MSWCENGAHQHVGLPAAKFAWPATAWFANYSSSCSYDNGAHWTRVASLAATSWWLRLRGTYTHVVSGARRGRLCVSLSRLVT